MHTPHIADLLRSRPFKFTLQQRYTQQELPGFPISYIVSALPEPLLCLPAANALRDVCDANRTALAPHIAAFGELHAGIMNIPVSHRVTCTSHGTRNLRTIDSRTPRKAKYCNLSQVSFKHCQPKRKSRL